MPHVELDWVALRPFQAEHPIGSGTVVDYEPGDTVPADDWGVAADHMANADIPKIAKMQVNVADPGDSTPVPGTPSTAGLSDPSRAYLQHEGQAPLDEPTLEPPEDATWPVHIGRGTYQLSDGTRVRTKQAAVEAQANLTGE